MSGIEIGGSLGLGTLIGWVFRSGRLAERVQQAQERAKKDSDGIARMTREGIAKQDRRWLFEIADRVQEAVTPEMRNRLADRIRQEAYRT